MRAILIALLFAVNAQRAAHHEPPVHFVPRVGVCNEVRPLRCVERHRIRAWIVGVVTAWGYQNAASAVDGWLHSPPHRAIMLDPEFRRAAPYYDGTIWRVVFVP